MNNKTKFDLWFFRQINIIIIKEKNESIIISKSLNWVLPLIRGTHNWGKLQRKRRYWRQKYCNNSLYENPLTSRIETHKRLTEFNKTKTKISRNSTWYYVSLTSSLHNMSERGPKSNSMLTYSLQTMGPFCYAVARSRSNCLRTLRRLFCCDPNLSYRHWPLVGALGDDIISTLNNPYNRSFVIQIKVSAILDRYVMFHLELRVR